MSVVRDVGKIAAVTARGGRGLARGVRATVSGTSRVSGWVRRQVGWARRRGGAGNVGMMRLLDLHAVSCAGDTLIMVGLAGTIFFSAPADEARGRMALYLLVTMVPFALLAPVAGPILDRFRHGRRLALAATMLGRAVLAWIIADSLFGFGLYPAAFGVLALSRAYGVARSAAVPRLLPPQLGLSQAGARASVYGTVAGAIVAPLGAAAFWFGPQWPLRIASLIFLVGALIALSLPPRADSDPPEVPPKIFQIPWRRTASGQRILSGRLVTVAIAGTASLRALYGFLLLFLAFTLREQHLSTRIAGLTLAAPAALGLVGFCLVLGSFVATVAGSALHIRRPVRLQALGFGAVALAGSWAAVRFSLAAAVALCLATAIATGLAKLAGDATIQERIGDPVRASAFAHSETLLMLAWVGGGALGLIPMAGRLGLALVAVATLLLAGRWAMLAWQLRGDMLTGTASAEPGRVSRPPTSAAQPPAATPQAPSAANVDVAPPGFHLFRPSGGGEVLGGGGRPGPEAGQPRRGAGEPGRESGQPGASDGEHGGRR
ncbi:MAG TPA: MFS transporter [Micromonosporaceae bacterium]